MSCSATLSKTFIVGIFVRLDLGSGVEVDAVFELAGELDAGCVSVFSINYSS